MKDENIKRFTEFLNDAYAEGGVNDLLIMTMIITAMISGINKPPIKTNKDGFGVK